MRCLSTFSASFALASAAAFFSTLPVNASPLAPSLKPRQDDSSPSGPKFIPSPVKHSGSLSSCHGYKASSIRKHSSGLEATLKLIGQPCHAYGTDYEDLHLRVNYDTEDRLHVTISDAEGKAHVVPKDVWPRPADSSVHSSKSNLKFEYVENPFSFSVTRNDGEVLFDTKGEPLVFEDQYIRVATGLPEDPNIYGLGDHNDPFRLPTANYSRTLWARDAYGVPSRTNLYGSHPIYHDHRLTASGPATHGVFLLNSNGMDVKLGNNTLSYEILGGIFDFYFFNGNTPAKVTRQYSEVVGKPAGMPYWGLGLHQCRYGYRDWIDVAEVVANYSEAGIPLETMWTDIDYMDARAIFTVDPARYPLERMREIVSNLHSNGQKYIVMVDPATAVRDYPTYNRGIEQDVFMKNADGSIYNGVVWPGRTSFPDWFHPNASKYWVDEFGRFFSPEGGIDIDGLWIDMNEAASFLPYIEANPDRISKEGDYPPLPPPPRDPPRPIPGYPSTLQARQPNADADANTTDADLQNRWLYPPYRINDVRAAPSGADGVVNAANAKNLSDFTLRTDLVHHNGEREYDVHNLYGHMMSAMSRKAMLARRPGKKPLILTRSTFSGSGSITGKWLGDNLSTWEQYIQTIRQMLGFAAIYSVPVVGADTCGFGANTTETLCARWAMLGAFGPFYRNHNGDTSIPQEFYRWPLVASAAKAAISIRYRLMDYIYTSLHLAQTSGHPVLEPLHFIYPSDSNTFGNEHQFFYGPHLLVSPVVDENATSVEIYLPDDLFYQFHTLSPVRGQGKNVTLDNVGFDEIPLHLRGGAIVPLRASSGMTTDEVRNKPFHLVVAPGLDDKASGSLYLDDGVSIEPDSHSYISMEYENQRLSVSGRFGYEPKSNKVTKVVFLNQDEMKKVHVGGKEVERDRVEYDHENKTLTITGLDIALERAFTIRLE